MLRLHLYDFEPTQSLGLGLLQIFLLICMITTQSLNAQSVELQDHNEWVVIQLTPDQVKAIRSTKPMRNVKKSFTLTLTKHQIREVKKKFPQFSKGIVNVGPGIAGSVIPGGSILQAAISGAFGNFGDNNVPAGIAMIHALMDPNMKVLAGQLPVTKSKSTLSGH